MSGDVNSLALAGAVQAAEGLAVLVQAAREGPLDWRTALPDDTIEKLADATKLAIEVELAAGHEIDSERVALLAALRTYLEGWAG